MKVLVQPLSLLPLSSLSLRGMSTGGKTGMTARTLGARVAAELRSLLVAGRLAPGEKLSLRKLAQALGVSIMPVREAVSQLAADGALEVLPGRAVRVPVLTLHGFRELTKLRLVVEGFAVEEAARNIGSARMDVISDFEEIFRKAASADMPDFPIAVAANHDFHFAVYQAAEMPTLLEMIERLWLKAGPILNLDMRGETGRLKEGSAVRAHSGLLAALRTHDPAAARAALQSDIETAARHIEENGHLLEG